MTGAKQKEYDDIPGTFVFDADRSRQGYHLNMFCMSLMKPGNRTAFKADEAAYLQKFPMTGEQRDAKGDDKHRGADLDAAQRQRRVARPRRGDFLRRRTCGHRQRRDGGNRDRGAQPHHKCRSDAGQEKTLRQRKDENDDGARAGP